MLNKIKVIGKVFPIEIKENQEKEKSEVKVYFSLEVTNPSDAITTLRCFAKGEIAEKLAKEIEGGEVIEIKGYLRNEKEGFQILIKVLEFTKLEIGQENIDTDNSNQVRLLGKIITDLNFRKNEKNGKTEVIFFKLLVPRKGDEKSTYFCRVHGELIEEVAKELKKNCIILLEGFLQTKREDKKIENEKEIEERKKIIRNSSIICRSFIFIDDDSVNHFHPLENLTMITKKVSKIDFTKPKE